MPDPYDRHGRSRDPDWGSQPPRSQQRIAAAQEPAKRSPAKKDPALCKGKHWKGPHEPEIRVSKWPYAHRKECHWAIAGWSIRKPFWDCRHVLQCGGCGKDMGKVPVSQCPEYHDITPEEKAVLDEELARWDEHRASWISRRKPVINGPQGYRKRRDATPGDSRKADS